MDASAWDARYAAVERVWSVGPNRFVAEELAGLPPGRAVDLAAGEGRNAVWLAGRGWQVTAVDFSAVALERGRQGADGTTSGVDWVVGDVLTCPLPADLDLALVAYLQLPHEEMARVVARAREALRPGGTFLLVCHDASNVADGVGGPQDPTVLSTADDVVGWLGDGVTVERAGRVTRETDAGTAYDLLVRAVRR